MADPKFKEAEANHGVDDKAAPIPEMIVPLKETNQIFLTDGGGLDLKGENPRMLEIKEDNGFVRNDLPRPHMFQLRGLALPGKGGLLAQARKGTKVTATLRVFVLDKRVVRLAVRPLQTAPGVFHVTGALPDIGQFVSKMNEIWGPQANVKIDLVFSEPALIDDSPYQIAREIGAYKVDKRTGQKLDPSDEQGEWPVSIPMVTSPPSRWAPNNDGAFSFQPVFKSYLENNPVKNVDFALFVVQAIDTGSGHTFGATDLQTRKFALVSHDATARQWAHELGHHLGGDDDEPKKNLLMESGAEGEKIPVHDAVNIFNKLHTATPHSKP
jgi:hypothetical protein